jgi:hypothetical protein
MEGCDVLREDNYLTLRASQGLTFPCQSVLLLNGNVTLLTVNANNAVATQLACYISTVISVASTLTGVLLSQTKHDVSAFGKLIGART